MKLKVLALSVLLACTLGACAQKQDWAGDPQLVHKLAVNMTADEVKKLLGEPSDTNSFEVAGIVTETWTYNGSQRVDLVAQNGKLKIANLDGKKIFEATVGEM